MEATCHLPNIMDKKKLVEKLQTRDNDSQLMSRTVKDFGVSVILTCIAALFASTVRPAFSSFNSGFSRTVGGFTITLPAYPVLTQDRSGLVKGSLAATVHLNNTNCSLHVQGSSPVSAKSNADTVQWPSGLQRPSSSPEFSNIWIGIW